MRRAIRLSPLTVKHYFNLGLSLLGTAVFTRVKALRDDPLDRLV